MKRIIFLLLCVILTALLAACTIPVENGEQNGNASGSGNNDDVIAEQPDGSLDSTPDSGTNSGENSDNKKPGSNEGSGLGSDDTHGNGVIIEEDIDYFHPEDPQYLLSPFIPAYEIDGIVFALFKLERILDGVYRFDEHDHKVLLLELKVIEDGYGILKENSTIVLPFSLKRLSKAKDGENRKWEYMDPEEAKNWLWDIEYFFINAIAYGFYSEEVFTKPLPIDVQQVFYTNIATGEKFSCLDKSDYFTVSLNRMHFIPVKDNKLKISELLSFMDYWDYYDLWTKKDLIKDFLSEENTVEDTLENIRHFADLTAKWLE